MIKNKALHIKIIFKTYLKILKTGSKLLLFYKTSKCSQKRFSILTFALQNIIEFSKTIFQNFF